MDRPQPISPELLSDLRNLRILNRYSGSYRLIRYFLRRWIDRDDRVRILDLATGSGDIPRLVVEFARKAGGQVEIDAVDLQASTIEIARQLSAGFPEIRYHCADIHHFGDENSYDIVLFSLALHHFSCDQAVALLRRCRSLSRGKVLVADLCRSSVCETRRRFADRHGFSRGDDSQRRARLGRALLFLPRTRPSRVPGWLARLWPSPLSFCPAGDLAGAFPVRRNQRKRMTSP